MKKLSLLALLFCLCSQTTNAQSCVPEFIEFFTQEEIDNFQTNFPGCTEIEGDVHITSQGNYDIANLTGLNVITSIGGSIFIFETPGLLSLSGLENLTSIGEWLHLENNNSLEDITALSNLTTCSMGIVIYNQSSLTSLSGLDGITSLDGELYIHGNSSLSNLSGLDGLISVGSIKLSENTNITSISGLNSISTINGPFMIEGNSSLHRLEGLESLSYIAGYLYVFDSELTDFTGLENLTHIGGGLTAINNLSLLNFSGLNSLQIVDRSFIISGNPVLNNLSSFENLLSIGINSTGTSLHITSNNSLSSLSGLENLEPNSIHKVEIFENSSLSECNVASICQYFANPNAVIQIYENAPGCNYRREVEEACETTSVQEENLVPDISIHPNPAQNTLFISSKKGIEIMQVSIYNQTVQLVLQKKRPANTIDVSMLQPGMYFIELVTDESRIREKLLIK